jgi:hypothetical protein
MVKLKKYYEDDLIEKFSLLLNEKKLKIRDQQRLLASANVDPAKAAAVERSRKSAKSGSAGPSKPRKRKAGQMGQDETDSDEGFEKMDVENQQDEATDSEGERPGTPDRDSTAEVETEDEDRPAPPAVRKTGSGRKTAELNTEQDGSDSDALPPRRDLPFSKKPASKEATPPTAAPTGGSETESDDDEL